MSDTVPYLVLPIPVGLCWLFIISEKSERSTLWFWDTWYIRYIHTSIGTDHRK